MQYIFGTKGDLEILKTKSKKRTDLSGYLTVKREYTDQTIIDSFHIVNKYRHDMDVEGYYYDWYVIDKHYRVSDKSDILQKNIDKTEDALLEEDTYMDERLSAVEDAICELDEQINGGE